MKNDQDAGAPDTSHTDTSDAVTSDAKTPGFRLLLPPDSTSIAVARSVIRRTVRFRNDDSESRFLTGFTDLLINAIEEHQRRGIDEPIVVAAEFGQASLVSITDVGGGYTASDADGLFGNPARVVHTDRMPERGRGVAIATLLVPGLTIDSSDSGTTVTLPLEGSGVLR